MMTLIERLIHQIEDAAVDPEALLVSPGDVEGLVQEFLEVAQFGARGPMTPDEVRAGIMAGKMRFMGVPVKVQAEPH